jgi:hypothetical protein
MKKMILFAVSMLAVGNLAAQKPSTAAGQVPIEEYVPKVIIEGKWGTGPGEFGMASRFPLGYFEQYKPSSLAVDSKGNIYILDFVNNRIQKFDKTGKYLMGVPVEGMKGELAGYCDEDTCYEEPPAPNQKIERKVMGQLNVQGINIVIDSKDNLYYYLKRVKDGKESGEVWQFRNDKLVKKTVVPVTNMLSYGVGLDLDREDDSLWIPDVDKKQRGKHYQFRTGKILNTDEVRKQQAAFKATEAGKKAAARPRPKYYLDIETSSNGIRVIEKLN